MRNTVPPYHLDNLLDTNPPQTYEAEAAATVAASNNWEALYPHTQAISLAQVEVYLDDFIGILQGGPDERRQMTRHLLRAIGKLFLPNTKDDTARKEPILLKNIHKCDVT